MLLIQMYIWDYLWKNEGPKIAWVKILKMTGKNTASWHCQTHCHHGRMSKGGGILVMKSGDTWGVCGGYCTVSF
jgi:hypothetical protein